MKLISYVLVACAWLIPGAPHRWACRLRAEKSAGAQAVQRFRG